MPRWNKPKGSHETRYSVAGKQEVPITLQQFKERMATGKFLEKSHRAFAVAAYYFGLKVSELRKAKKDQFSIQGNYLVFDVGKREKHSKTTDPLKISLNAPYLTELIEQVTHTPEGKIFDFCNKTAYNIMRRCGLCYPHYTRLNQITNLFLSGKSIVEVKSFTGLSLNALDHYVGKAGLLKIADSLGKD